MAAVAPMRAPSTASLSPSPTPILRRTMDLVERTAATIHLDVHEADRTTDSIDVENSSSSDEDDEEGVFFGSHTEAESRFLAQISGKSPATSASSSPSTPKGNRRQSRLVARIRKDSTEFHRRKTMIFPIRESQGRDGIDALPSSPRGTDRSLQERYQQELSMLQISPSAFASPKCTQSVGAMPQLRLVETLEALKIESATQEMDDSASSGVAEDSSEGEVASSDKENAPRQVVTDVAASVDGIVVGLESSSPVQQEVEDVRPGELLPLDLGGISRDDFDDVVDIEALASLESGMAAFDLGEDETPDEQGSPLGSRVQALRASLSPLRNEILLSPDSTSVGDTSTGAPSSQPASPAAVSNDGDRSQSSDVAGSEGIAEGDPDLDEMPVARAVFPTIAYPTFSPIRASHSPYRSTPVKSTVEEPIPSLSPPITDSATTLTGPVSEDLASPMRSPTARTTAETPLTVRTPRQLGPLPTTATPSRSWGNPARLAGRNTKFMKSQAISESSVRPPEPVIPAKDKSRALAVRSRLDAGFTSRPGMMGPPQRNVSSSSSQSSSSSISRPASRAGGERPASKASTLPTRPTSSASRLPPTSTLGQSAAKSSARAADAPGSAPPRPHKAFAKPAGPASRPALAPRSLVADPPKLPVTKPNPFKITRPTASGPIPVAANTVDRTAPPPIVPVAAKVNPLKRPLPAAHLSQPTRTAMTVSGSGASRPALGLPSRIVSHAGGQRSVSIFHVGAPPQENTMARIAMRSPARQAGPQRGPGTPLRVAKLGTPSRGDDTPRALRAKPSFQMMSASAHGPSQDVSHVPSSSNSGPPASATRQAPERSNSSPTVLTSTDPARGSSEDFEDVSMLLPQPPSSQTAASSPPETRSQSPSPKKAATNKQPATDDVASKLEDKAEGSRPERETRPVSRGRTRTPITPTAPWMTGKELKTTTDRNTMKNQVYLCAIDRQIVRKTGPRPPSPTSKIRTTADRDEQEKKQSREHRAKRRARDTSETAGEGSPERPLVERVERMRGPGDEEDWKTPARPAKKAKIRDDKSVKWDREVVIIRDDGSGLNPPASEGNDEPLRSCMRSEARVQLDKHGNMITTSRPKEDLKRSKVVVTAVFYDGEEPVPVPDFPTVDDDEGSSSSGRGKKKR